MFSDVEAAVLAGERVFQAIFDATGPIWMRGVIVGCAGVTNVLGLGTVRARGGLTIRAPGAALLDVLVAEKSGFKGFRLRVKTSLVSSTSRHALSKRMITEDPDEAVAPPTVDMWRTKSLLNAGAPNGDGFEEVLWMLDDEPRFNERDEELTYRLRRAGRNPAEAEHAAMTKVVFEEVRAIAGIVRR